MKNRLDGLSYSWGDAYCQEMQQSMLRRRIRWYSKRERYRLEPGNDWEPFDFTTEAQPGIFRAYIQGGSRRISTRSVWPEELKSQLWAFQFTENNSLSISTIGPKFPPDMDRKLMASDFVESIEELIQHGELSGESKFIQQVLRRLETVAQGDGGLVGPAFWPAEAETDFQTEILAAIRLSLGE